MQRTEPVYMYWDVRLEIETLRDTVEISNGQEILSDNCYLPSLIIQRCKM